MTRLDTRIVTALLARDSKDATYKFALLRAIVQCVTEQRAHKRIDENPFAREADDGSDLKHILPNAPYVISYPLGLLIYFWMFYYYPIFAHRVFIPQKHGEGPGLDAGRTIAFRREFNRVIDFYRDKGGLPQFRYDLIHESVPGGIRPAAVALMRKIQATIRNMPMRHLGFSLFGERYSLVRSTAGTIRDPSYAGLIRDAGRFLMHPDEKAACWKLVEWVRQYLLDRHHPSGINVGFNCGRSAGQTIFHAHIHVIPRYDSDTANPRGGVRHCIPEKGNY